MKTGKLTVSTNALLCGTPGTVSSASVGQVVLTSLGCKTWGPNWTDLENLSNFNIRGLKLN